MYWLPRHFTCSIISMAIMLLWSGYLAASPASPIDTVDAVIVERVLFIGHLNFDCIEDTVFSGTSKGLAYAPAAIGWGRPDHRTKGCSGDPGPFHPGNPASTNGVRTQIRYPHWEKLHCTAAFQEVNGDTLPDIIFFLRGKVKTDAGDRDTARAIVLFGQRNLDTITTISLDQVGAFEYARFFALDLRPGRDIIEPELRDISGIPSHEILAVAMDVNADSSITPQLWQENGRTLDVRVHPNPAAGLARIEGRLIPAGEYGVDIVAVNGELQRQQNVTVTASGDLFRMLDLRLLASGYYVVRLHQHGTLRATYPIIITH